MVAAAPSSRSRRHDSSRTMSGGACAGKETFGNFFLLAKNGVRSERSQASGHDPTGAKSLFDSLRRRGRMVRLNRKGKLMTTNERWGWISRMTSTRPVMLFVFCFIVAGVAALPTQAQTFTTLYNFTGGSNGEAPYAGVIQDPSGNLYGTTGNGNGLGTVYELTAAGKEIVLYGFTSDSGGSSPYTPVIRDKAGNIYGTTFYGGSEWGVVFKLDTAGNETVLHTFTGGKDGCHPYQGLLMDKAGNLYGTTSYCGSSDKGTVFKVDTAGNFSVLHSFAGVPSDGGHPLGGHLTMDESGNLYGLTSRGGAASLGTLYKLSKRGTFTLLHSFGVGLDGSEPWGSVLRDKTGNLYGTTTSSCGIIWMVSNSGEETILHHFAGRPSDGCFPYAGVARDSNGNLYGVTRQGGAHNLGALYELSAKGTLILLHSFDSQFYPLGEVLRTSKGVLIGTAQQGGTYGYGTVWKYVP